MNVLDWFLDGFLQAGLIEYVFFGLAFFYVLLMTFLTIGIVFNKRTTAISGEENDFPIVTVLVSARNEEKDIASCIESLVKLDYPHSKLQIILVNDRSTDKTDEIILKAARDYSFVTALDTKDYENTKLEAKARGIGLGFTKAIGEWVFITDADAVVHPQWIKHSLGNVSEKTGMLGGALMVNPNGLIGKIERMSWSFVQMFNLGMAGYKVPFICVGPNMAIRRSIYVNAGGLEAANFSVAEDLALFKMVMNAGYSINTYFSVETLVHLKPVPSFKHLFSQQHRWFRGGLDGGDDYVFMLFVGFSWGFLAMLYVWIGWALSLQLYVFYIICKLLVDFTFLAIQKKRLKLGAHKRYQIIFEVYITLFAMFVLPSFFGKKTIEWMGEGYVVTYKP